jgi:hypothetical protein
MPRKRARISWHDKQSIAPKSRFAIGAALSLERNNRLISKATRMV